jgi:ABC-type branched-subunit amino acid transport system ATPase component
MTHQNKVIMIDQNQKNINRKMQKKIKTSRQKINKTLKMTIINVNDHSL